MKRALVSLLLLTAVLALWGGILTHAEDGVAEDVVAPDTAPANPLVPYLIAGLIGAATVGVPGYIVLCLFMDRAYWLGIRDYRGRARQDCSWWCETCEDYPACLKSLARKRKKRPGRGE